MKRHAWRHAKIVQGLAMRVTKMGGGGERCRREHQTDGGEGERCCSDTSDAA
jgi:hypothetical protein